jgi:UDP-N-acetylmuramoyl-tripeptide--D-alanyl-D-alanine ligase
MATPIPRNTARFTVDEITRATGGKLVRGDASASAVGVAIDSRAVSEGALFVAIRGEQQDGARYLPSAIAQGAKVVLVHEGTDVAEGPACIQVADTTRALGDLAHFHRKRWGGTVVAVTGSAGKTTTKDLTAAAFSALGARVLKTEGNLNNQFGLPMTLFCLTRDHDLAMLELGTSGRGEIARLGEICAPDVAMVLLAALAHTAGIGSLEDVATEKSSLFRALGSKGIGVVNADDSNLMARVRSDIRTLTFGASAGADVRLVSSELDVKGTRAVVECRGELYTLTLPLVGHAAALDSAAALAAVLALHGEQALDNAVQGFEHVAPASARMEVHQTADGVFLIDDSYNANPKSVALSLDTVKELARARGSRAIAVVGDMLELGAHSQREHAKIGEHAVRAGIDVLVGAGAEMAHATAAAARLAAGRLAPHPTRVVHVLMPRDAVPIVRSLWRAGDVVLVKGSRSMAMEHVFADLLGVPSEGKGRAP